MSTPNKPWPPPPPFPPPPGSNDGVSSAISTGSFGRVSDHHDHYQQQIQGKRTSVQMPLSVPQQSQQQPFARRNSNDPHLPPPPPPPRMISSNVMPLPPNRYAPSTPLAPQLRIVPPSATAPFPPPMPAAHPPPLPPPPLPTAPDPESTLPRVGTSHKAYSTASAAATSTRGNTSQRIDPSQIPHIPSWTIRQPITAYNPDSSEKPPEAYEGYMVVPNSTVPTRNTSPYNMRCTTFAFPQSKFVAKQCSIPLGLCVMPFQSKQEQQIPTIPYSSSTLPEPIRCKSCHAYLNPFDTILPNNSNNTTIDLIYKCIFCGTKNSITHNNMTYQHSSFGSLDQGGITTSAIHTDILPICTSYGLVDHVVQGRYNIRDTQRQPYFMYAIDLKLVYDGWDRISNTYENHVLPKLKREITVLFQQQQQTTNPHSTLFSPKIGFFLFDQHACYFPHYSSYNEYNDGYDNNNNSSSSSKSNEQKLQMAVMADMCEDPFCPLPLDMISYDIVTNDTSDFSKSLFHQLLEAIPNLVLGMTPASTATSAAAVGAAMTVLHSALGATGGRGSIITFYQDIMGRPTTNILLKSQKQHQQLKEQLISERKFYENLGEQYHKASIRLDVLLVVVQKQKHSHTPSSINLLTLINHVCNTTCGKLRKIHLDTAPIVAATEECPLALEMSKLCTIVDTATDAVLKLRMSNGIRLNSHRPFSARQVSGQCIVVNDLESPELEMAHIGAESCIVMNLEHSTGASLESKVYFQVALLFTTPLGQRRVRVMNLCLCTTATPSVVFRNADYCGLSAVLSRYLVSDFWESYYDNHYQREHDNSTATILALERARSQLVDTVVQILTCYRLNTTASKSPLGQLILPETLQLLPLWSLSALKSASLRGNIRGRTTWDDRINHLQALLESNPSIVTVLVHPNMYRVDKLDTGQGECIPHIQKEVQTTLGSKSMGTSQPYFQLPETIPCSMSCMEDDGVYIIDDAFTLYVYVGKNVSSSVMSELFDVTSPVELHSKIVASGRVGVVGLDWIRKDSALGGKVRAMLFALRNWFDKERPTSTPIVLQTGIDSDNADSNLLQYLLVDDPYPEEEEKGYVDFLCMLHKRIRHQVDKEQNRL